MCVLLTIAYSLKSVGIVIECISYHNDTNKCNNCLNLICMLNDRLITKQHYINNSHIKQLKSKLIGTRNVAKVNRILDL